MEIGDVDLSLASRSAPVGCMMQEHADEMALTSAAQFPIAVGKLVV